MHPKKPIPSPLIAAASHPLPDRPQAEAAAEPRRNGPARGLRLLPVYPDGHLWRCFLDRFADYVGETWPDACRPDQRQAFVAETDEELRARLRQGGRWYFMLQSEGRNQGLANLYSAPLSCPEPSLSGRMSLQIAEFTIFPASRRAGLGSAFVDALGDWSRLQGLSVLSAEVDEDNVGAHAFWSKQRMRRISPENARPVYVRSSVSAGAAVDFPVGDFHHRDLCLEFRGTKVRLLYRDELRLTSSWEMEGDCLNLGDISSEGEEGGSPGLLTYFLGRLLHEARRVGAKTIMLAGAAHAAALADQAAIGIGRPRPTVPGSFQWSLEPARLVWVRHAPVRVPKSTVHFPKETEIAIREEALSSSDAAYLRTLTAEAGILFSSALERSRQTALGLVRGTPTSVHPLQDLDEYFPDHLIGMSLAAAEQRYGSDLLRRLPSLILSESIDNVESREVAQERLRSACLWIMELPLPRATRLLIGHGLAAEIFRAACQKRENLPPEDIEGHEPLGCLSHWTFLYYHLEAAFMPLPPGEQE